MSLSKMSRPRQTWLSSLDLSDRLKRRASTSSQGAVVLPSPTSPVSDPNWYKRVACCQLESIRGTGQGLLVDISQLAEALGLTEVQPLALLTNHHIIHCMSSVQGWKLQVWSDGIKRGFSLSNRSFTRCFSCCGPDGLWGGAAHFQQSASDPPTSCPVGSDFTLLLLSPSFTTELTSKCTSLLFPPLLIADKEEHHFNRFCILQRDFDSGIISPSHIDLQPIAPPSDDPSLQREIDAYKESCVLRYSHNWITGIGRGSSGSGIFCHDERSGEIRLMGIHVSSGVDDAQTHYGLTVQAIVHSIVGGPTCGVIPALSLLMDASKRNRLAARWYQNLQSCLIHEDMNLERYLRIMDLLLKVDPAIFKFTFGDSTVLPSLTLLAALFRCFERFVSGQIHKEAEEVLTADGSAALNQNVQKHCKQLHELLKDAHQRSNTKIVETSFQCWHDMYCFGGPVYGELYDSAKISSLKGIRENQKYNNCVAVHRAFGDIFMAYERKRRDVEHREYQRELLEKAQQFEKEKEDLEERVQEHVALMERELQERKLEVAEWRARGEGLVKQLQDKEQEMEEERERKEGQLQENAQELAEARKRGEDLEQQLQERAQELVEMRKRGEDLEQQLQERAQELAEMRKRGEDLEQQLQERAQELAEMRKRGEDLEQQLQERAQELAEMRMRGEEQLKERERELGMRIEHLEQQLQERWQELAEMREERQNLEQRYQQEGERSNALEQEMTRSKLALEQLRVEKQRLNEENESQARIIQELYQQQQERSPVRRVNSMPGTSPMSSSASLYPTRRELPSLLVPDSEKEFWDRSIVTLLKDVHGFRTRVGQLFAKVGGSDGADWERLIEHLNLNMDASKLEAQPPGDIVLKIVQVWEKKENVTVARFCEVSRAIGINTIGSLLHEAAEKELGNPLADLYRDSASHNI